MKIFSSEQIRELDAFTIKHEPVTSIDLMERAAGQLFKWITERYGRSSRFIIFSGPGNNGGDGLALARMLGENDYSAEVYYLKFTDKVSDDWLSNRRRLEKVKNVPFKIIENSDQFPDISDNDIIIDAIFGSGLTRAAEGLPLELIKEVNNSNAVKISVDIPSGLFGENNGNNSYEGVVKADITLSFQFPKLSFMFAENASCLGDWYILPIGLDKSAIDEFSTPYFLLENRDIVPLIKKRNKFDHKGNFGHGLLISGSEGKMGAAVLAAHAALRTGIGLMTCHIPKCGSSLFQCSLPEAMVINDASEECISETGNTDSYTSVGIGPGIGTRDGTQTALFRLISECRKPMVIDADALNILSLNKDWISLLPPGTILTPHVKEFERLVGKTNDGYERLLRQIEFCMEHNCIVVLKGAHTSIASPDGNVAFNSTGNPGMAKGGSGDILTGIILSLLAQGYSPYNAAVFGVYLHGKAGDIAVRESSCEAILASDIINCIGKAFNSIRDNGS